MADNSEIVDYEVEWNEDVEGGANSSKDSPDFSSIGCVVEPGTLPLIESAGERAMAMPKLA